MHWKQVCISGAVALGLLMGSEAHAYRGYVPIRPANTIRPQKEPDVYGHPGVISLNRTWWDGRDDLADIPKNLRIVTDVLYSPSECIWLPLEEAQAELEKELKFAGFNISPPYEKPDDPFRPYLQLLVFVLPVDRGYALQIALRLFEKDDNFKRGHLQPHEAWQVMTWERQMLSFAAKGDLICNVRRDVQALAEEFTRRWTLDNRTKKAVVEGRKQRYERGCSSNCQWRAEWDCCR